MQVVKILVKYNRLENLDELVDRAMSVLGFDFDPEEIRKIIQKEYKK